MSRILPVNVHPIERVLRIAAGAALIGAAYTGAIGAWGYSGVVPILTGLLRTCPAYTLLGVSTCPIRTSTPAH